MADISARKVFVGGLSWETTSESLRRYFERYGDVADATAMRDSNTGQPRGFGFVVYKESAAVDRLLSVSDHFEVDGKRVEVKRAVPREVLRNETSSEKKIFVSGLPPDVGEGELKSYFGKFGTVEKAYVVLDRYSRKSRGFGFVEFTESTSIHNVLQECHHAIAGQTVEVKQAEPYVDKSSDGRGGGGRGGGRGGGGRDGYYMDPFQLAGYMPMTYMAPPGGPMGGGLPVAGGAADRNGMAALMQMYSMYGGMMLDPSALAEFSRLAAYSMGTPVSADPSASAASIMGGIPPASLGGNMSYGYGGRGGPIMSKTTMPSYYRPFSKEG